MKDRFKVLWYGLRPWEKDNISAIANTGLIFLNLIVLMQHNLSRLRGRENFKKENRKTDVHATGEAAKE